MKKTFLSLAVMATSTFFIYSCQSDNDHKIEEETFKTQLRESYTNRFEIANKITETINDDVINDKFTLSNDYISNLLTPYDIPNKKLINIELIESYINILQNNNFEDRDEIKMLLLKSFEEFTVELIFEISDSKDVTSQINSSAFENLPEKEKNLILELISVQNDYNSYYNSNSAYKSKSAYGLPPLPIQMLSVQIGMIAASPTINTMLEVQVIAIIVTAEMEKLSRISDRNS